MPDAGNDALRGLEFFGGGAGQRRQVQIGVGLGHRFVEHLRAALDAADEHGAQSGQARGDRGLHGLRRAQVGQPRHQRAGRDPVLDQRDHHRVEHPRFVRSGNPPRELQKAHVAQVQMAQYLAGKVAPEQGDAGRVAPAYVSADRLVLPCHRFTPSRDAGAYRLSPIAGPIPRLPRRACFFHDTETGFGFVQRAGEHARAQG